MTFMPRTRLVNPRLGTYFGIFTSAFVAVVIMLAMLERLGLPAGWVRAAMLAVPLMLYAAIGAGSFTREPIEYFAAGRRVPAGYGGIGLSLTALGGTGVVGIAGGLFIVGYDALCLAIGALAGFVVMAVLLAPFIRKFGAYTVPSYLGRRFESKVLRLAAAGTLSVPMLLMLSAELHVGAAAASGLTGWPTAASTFALAIALVVVLAAGGVRALTWSSVAQCIAVLLAIIVPVAIVGVYLTNFPLAQLSHGPSLRSLTRFEQLQGMPIVIAPPWAFDLPGEGIQAMAKRFAQPFGNVGPAAFVAATLTIMAGVSAAPWLLPRVAAAPGVYEARKSIGWATFYFGILLLTLSAAAGFMRFYIMDLTGEAAAVVPSWLRALVDLGIASVDVPGGKLTVNGIALSRDGVLYALTLAARLPPIILYLVYAGIVAVTLAAAGAAAATLGNILAEDVVNGLTWEIESEHFRVHVARAGLVVAALLGALIAVVAPTDPLRLLLWALALTGSTAFPVLVLSIWWKRINALGALAGVVTGFAVAVLAIVAGEANWIGLDGGLAAVFGIPASLAAAIVASLLTPPPSRHVLELVRDIRVPGGEILYDREMRLARLKRRQMAGPSKT